MNTKRIWKYLIKKGEEKRTQWHTGAIIIVVHVNLEEKGGTLTFDLFTFKVFDHNSNYLFNQMVWKWFMVYHSSSDKKSSCLNY